MAERKGFEPLIPLTVYTLSKRAPSTPKHDFTITFLINIESQKQTLVQLCDRSATKIYVQILVLFITIKKLQLKILGINLDNSFSKYIINFNLFLVFGML